MTEYSREDNWGFMLMDVVRHKPTGKIGSVNHIRRTPPGEIGMCDVGHDWSKSAPEPRYTAYGLPSDFAKVMGNGSR